MKSAAPLFAAPAPAPAAAPVSHPAAARTSLPLTAAHGFEITALSLTADGSALASADKGGGIRLWPTLDGTHEPIVIVSTAPRALSLARDGDGFALATLDSAGGVRVIRTTALGAIRDRVSVPGAQPATEIDATPGGFLVLRADQTIELVALTGAVTAHLMPEPGSHVDAILTRGTRALALVLVLEDKQLHGRWLELAHGLAWGATTPRLEGQIAHAVLSPAGDQLAVTRPRSVHPALIDLKTGAALKTPLCVTKGWPREEGMDMADAEIIREGATPIPLGFVAGNVVACSVMSSLLWWDTSGSAVSSQAGSFMISGMPSDIADGVVVAAQGTNLALGSVTSTHYLGYALHDVSHLHTGPGGILVSGADQQSLELDQTLAPHARFELGRNRIDWTDAIPLDDRYAITLTPRHAYRNEGVQAAVFDGVSATTHQLLPYSVREPELAYEPTTRLLALTDGPVSLLVQLDPETHTFGKPMRIANGITAGKLKVVDPAQTGGVAALEIDDSNGGVIVGEILARDIAPGAVLEPHTSYRVPGELRAVDRAGRLYMRSAAQGDVVVYTHGTAGARLAGMAPLTLRPNADGSLIAGLASPRVALAAANGDVKWDTAHWNATEIGWAPGGALVAQFATAVATVDLATGALADRHCGWSFGLAEQPFDAGRGSPTICDIAR